MSPSAPDSMIDFTCRTAPLYMKVCPTITIRPLRSARLQTCSASAVERARGFSMKTCLPASSTLSATAAWDATGVATTTASTDGSDSACSGSVAVCAAGASRRARSRAAGLKSLTQLSRSFWLCDRTRHRFAPQ